MRQRSPQSTEARHWLAHNESRAALAGNRFGSTEAACAFVDQLYDSGAVLVEVANVLAEDWRIAQEGGPYADTLVVTLPTDAAQRHALFRIQAEEAEGE